MSDYEECEEHSPGEQHMFFTDGTQGHECDSCGALCESEPDDCYECEIFQLHARIAELETRLVGMTGERDAEREISQEREAKCDELEKNQRTPAETRLIEAAVAYNGQHPSKPHAPLAQDDDDFILARREFGKAVDSLIAAQPEWER